MEQKTQYMTKNDCYKQGKSLTPQGVMVHSTASPGVMAAAWFDRWNKAGVTKCVHAFVDDKEVCQYLPWDMRGWHCGGSGNSTLIGFEICEDKAWSEAYFAAAWDNAVTLTAQLCRKYGLPAQSVISHREGHARGIASNHGDPDHWWGKFGRTMDDFRRAVAQALGNPSAETVTPVARRMRVNVPAGDFLAVRARPANGGTLVGKLLPGEVVEVYETNAAGWCRLAAGWSYGGKGYLQETEDFAPYIVRVTTDALNIRKGPGTGYDIAGCIRDRGSYTIVEEQSGWGRLKSGAGWISLNYTQRR